MHVSERVGFSDAAGFCKGVVDPGLNLLYTYSPEAKFDNDFVERDFKRPEKFCRLKCKTPAKSMISQTGPEPSGVHGG
jgi:hypothetical protein